jgi:adenylate cyclase
MTIERHDSWAVLFADIGGSTMLYEVVGDEQARVTVAQTLDRWSGMTADGGGRVIQLRGDGILCTFPSVDAALRAASAMRDLRYDMALSMHAGVHVGGVLLEADQLYGDAVNVAARMADIAKRFEIVLSEAAYERLTDVGRRAELRLIRHVPVKGKRTPMDIYLLPSNRQTLTDYRPPTKAKSLGVDLTLRFGPRVLRVDARSAPCVMGRDQECLVIVAHPFVSRRHASIECISGRYFLHDHSSNGTYVTEADGREPALVQREVWQLLGQGTISLGIEPHLNPEHLIAFALEI